MCTHKKINKCKCHQCLCTGDGSLLNVKRATKKKTKQSVYYYFAFHGCIKVVT